MFITINASLRLAKTFNSPTDFQLSSKYDTNLSFALNLLHIYNHVCGINLTSKLILQTINMKASFGAKVKYSP